MRDRGQISIHALRGEGDLRFVPLAVYQLISIHALRGEGDFLASGIKQSRLIISIHALRGEGDDR